MGRFLSVILVGWALLGLPALCVAGVLPHACSCAESCRQSVQPCCAHESSHSQHGDCSHESDCGSDPCSGTVVRAVRQNSGVEAPALWPIASVSKTSSAQPDLYFCELKDRYGGQRSPLPFHRSDIPLLA